jgi:hypothetical protein
MAWPYSRAMHVSNLQVSKISKCVGRAVRKLVWLLSINSVDHKRRKLRALDKSLVPLKKSNHARNRIRCTISTRRRVHAELREVEWLLWDTERYVSPPGFGYRGVIHILMIWCEYMLIRLGNFVCSLKSATPPFRNTLVRRV